MPHSRHILQNRWSVSETPRWQNRNAEKAFCMAKTDKAPTVDKNKERNNFTPNKNGNCLRKGTENESSYRTDSPNMLSLACLHETNCSILNICWFLGLFSNNPKNQPWHSVFWSWWRAVQWEWVEKLKPPNLTLLTICWILQNLDPCGTRKAECPKEGSSAPELKEAGQPSSSWEHNRVKNGTRLTWCAQGVISVCHTQMTK